LHFTHFLFSSSTLSVKLTVQQARKPWNDSPKNCCSDGLHWKDL
jgi:hypothetical protein